MMIHKKASLVFKKLNERPSQREISFYRHKKLKLSLIFSILRELIFILKGSNISAKSAQITYTFILAIVPFLSILFTFIHSLHGFDNIFATSISPLIKKHLGNEVGLQISKYLQSIIQNIQVKELGIISFFTFSITVILLLVSIEDNLNSIMKIENHMSFFQRFLKCWIIITVSPFLFALTAVNSAPLFHLIRENVPPFLESTLLKTLRTFLGIFFQACYFLFLYYVMPSKRLNFKSVLIGGLVASLLFEIVQYISIYLAKSAMSADPSKIYGTVPLIAILFFAWIRLVWLVTLIGAGATLATQTIFFPSKEGGTSIFPAKDMIECVSVYCAISKFYKESGFPVPINRIVSVTKIPLSTTMKWIHFLIKKGVIYPTNNEHSVDYSPSYKAIQEEINTSEFLKNILFSSQSNSLKNYNDIEKYFDLCLKGESI